MYKLMDMEPPAIKVKKKKKVPKLKIDRTGESDPARYTGLKMGQVLDDDTMGKALEEFNRKKRARTRATTKVGRREICQTLCRYNQCDSLFDSLVS